MKYRMTIMPAIEAGDHMIRFKFETFEQMVVARNCAADLLIFLQDTAKVMPDYSNSIYLEELVDGEWEECVEDWED